jgi:hypothetical protein
MRIPLSRRQMEGNKKNPDINRLKIVLTFMR